MPAAGTSSARGTSYLICYGASGNSVMRGRLLWTPTILDRFSSWQGAGRENRKGCANRHESALADRSPTQSAGSNVIFKGKLCFENARFQGGTIAITATWCQLNTERDRRRAARGNTGSAAPEDNDEREKKTPGLKP